MLLNKHIAQAVHIIQNGGLVAFPTDTVYGLGGDATNEFACNKIFETKGRLSSNPLIIHVANIEQVKNIAHMNKDAIKLSILWPGPLTMVLPLKKKNKISKKATANLDTIAIRIPNSKLTLDIINYSNTFIAAPSANLSNFLTTTSYQDVKYNFPENIYIIPNENPNACGIESTIIDLTKEQPVLLRPGYIVKNQLSAILGKEILLPKQTNKIKSPGMFLKHYSPKSKIRLNASFLEIQEVGLDFGKSGNFDSRYPRNFSLNLSNKSCLIEATKNLFAYLHQLDYHALNYKKSIAVAPIENQGLGYTINDRLKRAAYE
ncbi:MAG: threonylcarbamoyl-AMP synthase [Rickettsia sp.]|nr:threonylcarbamoyl-AMP synthase [Rickettsia sp.]